MAQRTTPYIYIYPLSTAGNKMDDDGRALDTEQYGRAVIMRSII